MSTWQSGKLGDFITLQRGFDLPRQDRRAGKVPVVSSSGISDHVAESKVKRPGVVTGRYGTIGQVFFITEDYWPLNTTLYVKDFKGNDPRFVSYFLQTLDFASCSDKSSVPGVNRNDLHTLPVTFPPLPEQREIARILGALDDKIELNRRMNATLEAMARALFKCWFVDFEPVRIKQAARARGDDPSAALCRPPSAGGLGLDPAIAALFPDSFEDSPLGEIPKGWRVVSMDRMMSINPTRRLGKGLAAVYLDMKNVPTNGYRPLGWIKREFTSGMKFCNGDTLLARITPCLENGKTAYVDFLEEGETGWGSTEFIVLTSKPPVPALYTYLLARSDDFRNYAIANMTGSSGRQRVPSDTLSSYQIVRPSDELLVFLGQCIKPLFSKITINDENAMSLSHVRDALLPRLVSGAISLG